LSLNDVGKYPKEIEKSFKIIWSPRFIHYDELLLLMFYYYHNTGAPNYVYTQEVLVDKFAKINFIPNKPFIIESTPIFDNYDDYILDKISIPSINNTIPDIVNIAVGSIDITTKKCSDGLDRWKNINIDDKKLLYDILLQSHDCFNSKDRGTMLLVFPELYFPVYWIRDLIRFARDNQIGIVTRLQYIIDKKKCVHNYLATILPFKIGKNRSMIFALLCIGHHDRTNFFGSAGGVPFVEKIDYRHHVHSCAVAFKGIHVVAQGDEADIE